MILSIPLSVLTSRERAGAALRRMGLFITPEETQTPPEIARLHEQLSTEESFGEAMPLAPNHGLHEAVLDPYVNAIHVSLLREKRLNPHYAEAFAAIGAGSEQTRQLGEKLLAQGPGALSRAEQIAILSDADTMSWLHRQAWMRAPDQLAEQWRTAIRRYNT
jgi:membrane glycosyltransferase